jgi:regulator of sirC expression with transglutaminase-like and TPR domain
MFALRFKKNGCHTPKNGTALFEEECRIHLENTIQEKANLIRLLKQARRDGQTKPAHGVVRSIQWFHF